jgi:hypothetical protein
MGSSSARLAQLVTEKHQSDKYLALIGWECQDQELKYGVGGGLSSGGFGLFVAQKGLGGLRRGQTISLRQNGLS